MTMIDSTTASGLPAQFADLEPFAEWILDTQPKRYAARLAHTMAELQAFYDAAFPRIADMLAYCDAHDLADLPEDVKQVMYLLFSLVEVSFPVECWRQPRVPDSGAASMDLVVEPAL